MAGSLDTFLYTDDSGLTYGVTLAEEWGNNTASGFTKPQGSTAYNPLPKGWRMRYAYAHTKIGEVTVTRKFPFGKTSATGWVAGKTFTHQSKTWTVNQTAFPERRVKKAKMNTGQDVTG